MNIRTLSIFGYRGRLDYEWGESFDHPAWAGIDVALRRLDAGEFAGVVLHQNDYRDGELATDALAVTGGPGCYLVTCSIGGKEVAMINAEIPDGKNLVAVCRRDQGIWVSERKVCRNLEWVLTAAWHYAETGQPWPAVTWE